MKSISIIVPIYNESEIIELFSSTLNDELNRINNIRFEIVFINNSSTDDTFFKIKKIKFKNHKYKIVDLSNYFGKEAAILAGLEIVTSDAYVVIDPDLEDPPALIKQMIDIWIVDKKDIVYTKKTYEDISILKKTLKKLFYIFLFSLVPKNQTINPNVGDFRLISRRVRDEILTFREKTRFFRNIVSLINLNSGTIEFERPKRIKGKSKSNLNFLFNYALDCLFSSEGKPLSLLTYVSFIMIFISLSLTILLIIKKIFGLGIILPGFTFVTVLLLTLFSLNFLFLSFIGEYCHRILREAKNRKHYIVNQIIDIE